MRLPVAEAIQGALDEQRFADMDRVQGVDPAVRWLVGGVTRFCGRGFHQGVGTVGGCRGSIHVMGFMAPCRCACHRVPA